MAVWAPGSLDGDAATTEAIASRDGNNLYQASCFMQEPERYRSFCAFYSIMRVVDDAIDSLPPRGGLQPEVIAELAASLRAWEQAILAMTDQPWPQTSPGGHLAPDAIDALFRELRIAASRFPIPRRCWTRFFRSMRRDLLWAPFPTYRAFLEYTEGASVAPTFIFLILASARPSAPESYVLSPEWRVASAARHLGRFAYLAHILRDLSVDLADPENPLVYLAAEDLAAYGLSLTDLLDDVQRGRCRPAVRGMVADLAKRSRGELSIGQRHLGTFIDQIAPPLGRVILFTVAMYDEILRRIESTHDPILHSARLSAHDQSVIASRVMG